MYSFTDFFLKFRWNSMQNNGGGSWKSKDELVEMEKYRQFTFALKGGFSG